MAAELDDLSAFVTVVRAGGFRDGARVSGVSASSLSEALRRLEAKLGVRLLNRTTRSISPTEAGARLLERLVPALGEIEAAMDVVNAFRDRPAGTLKLNVPGSAARLVLPAIVTPFLKAYPDIRLEVIVEEGFVDVLASGCDAGIRYEERLEQDMIAVPIGPRVQRFATAASPAYLTVRGEPRHPRDLLTHAACGASSPAAPRRPGTSSATAKSCASTLAGRCWCGWARRPTSPSAPRSTASAWCTCSRTGYVPRWTGARSRRCS